ncbi:hypothetical protein [Rhizobium leguminosarum]|nr:hypothetical protein [Rhizobium leguminosarum]
MKLQDLAGYRIKPLDRQNGLDFGGWIKKTGAGLFLVVEVFMAE